MPLGAIYLNIFDLGLAPLALIGVFAITVGDALTDGGPSRRWAGFGGISTLSGPSAAPSS